MPVFLSHKLRHLAFHGAVVLPPEKYGELIVVQDDKESTPQKESDGQDDEDLQIQPLSEYGHVEVEDQVVVAARATRSDDTPPIDQADNGTGSNAGNHTSILDLCSDVVEYGNDQMYDNEPVETQNSTHYTVYRETENMQPKMHAKTNLPPEPHALLDYIPSLIAHIIPRSHVNNLKLATSNSAKRKGRFSDQDWSLAKKRRRYGKIFYAVHESLSTFFDPISLMKRSHQAQRIGFPNYCTAAKPARKPLPLLEAQPCIRLLMSASKGGSSGHIIRPEDPHRPTNPHGNYETNTSGVPAGLGFGENLASSPSTTFRAGASELHNRLEYALSQYISRARFEGPSGSREGNDLYLPVSIIVEELGQQVENVLSESVDARATGAYIDGNKPIEKVQRLPCRDARTVRQLAALRGEIRQRSLQLHDAVQALMQAKAGCEELARSLRLERAAAAELTTQLNTVRAAHTSSESDANMWRLSEGQLRSRLQEQQAISGARIMALTESEKTLRCRCAELEDLLEHRTREIEELRQDFTSIRASFSSLESRLRWSESLVNKDKDLESQLQEKARIVEEKEQLLSQRNDLLNEKDRQLRAWRESHMQQDMWLREKDLHINRLEGLLARAQHHQHVAENQLRDLTHMSPRAAPVPTLPPQVDMRAPITPSATPRPIPQQLRNRPEPLRGVFSIAEATRHTTRPFPGIS